MGLRKAKDGVGLGRKARVRIGGGNPLCSEFCERFLGTKIVPSHVKADLLYAFKGVV
jgi:hypothetical protein